MVKGGRGSVGSGDGAMVASGVGSENGVFVALGDGSAVDVVGVALAVGFATGGANAAVGVGSRTTAVAVGGCVAVCVAVGS